MKRKLIVLKKFIGNATCKCEVIEQKENHVSLLSYDIMNDNKLSLYIKRKNMKKLTFTIQSTNYSSFEIALSKHYNATIFSHDVF